MFRGQGNVTAQHEAAGAHPLGFIDTYPENCPAVDRLFKFPEPPHLIQYVDTEYGRNRSTSRSNEDRVIFLDGNIVPWSTKTQTRVALNT